MKPTPLSIFRAVAREFGLEDADMFTRKNRDRDAIAARQIAAYISRFFGYSLADIKRSLNLAGETHGALAAQIQSYLDRSAMCERRHWADRVLAAHGLPSVDGLGGALAERARIELAA